MCRETNEFDNDKVEITLKGSAIAIGDILTGNVTRVLEDKMDVQRELERTREERDTARRQESHVKQDLAGADLRSLAVLGEAERRFERVLVEQERQLTALRAEVQELKNQTSGELTEEQYAKLATERENVFQSLMADVTFPVNKPKPQTLAELFSFFVFPIFEAGAADDGQWRRACVNKIAMIKQLRELTGAGLKEAKDFIEGTAKLG